MKKTLLVLALVALASVAASAKTYNISFDGFCDAMELTTSGPTPALIFAGGVHDFSACELPSVYVGGFRHSFYTSIDPGGGSTVIDLVDPTLGYLYGIPYSLQYLINTSGGCSWSNYVDFGEGHLLNSTGTCTDVHGPVKAAAGTKPSFKRPSK